MTFVTASSNGHCRLVPLLVMTGYAFFMRGWRNWQTRTFEGRVGNRTGSSPVLRTTIRVVELDGSDFFFSCFL